MIPGMNPKKMQEAMKKLGLSQEEIEANTVIIEQDNGRIVIENPSVIKMIMQGNESWQITGEAREETQDNNEDIKIIVEKTGKSEEEAKEALEKSSGDLAQAIMDLS